MAPVTQRSLVDSLPSVLGRTLGAIYVGATIAAVLYGMTIHQTVTYYKGYPNDSWHFRYGVAFLWVLDTLHVALSTHALYYYLIESFGNYLQVLKTNLLNLFRPQLQIIANILIVVGVQGLYAVRVWKFGRNFHKVLPCFIFLAVAACLGEISVVIMIEDLNATSKAQEYVHSIKLSGNPQNQAVAADFFIAATMCYYLHKGREMAGLSSTTKVIVGLMRFAVMSGLTTSTSLGQIVSFSSQSISPCRSSRLNARKAQRGDETKECYSTDNSTLRFARLTISSGTSNAAGTSVNAAPSVMERSDSNDGTERTCT
ncbi:hypothetical protein EDD18DRAFT_1113021 [Armillaria luteobubalina]|uniref:DUF6534 domain-containing protein n=1 Tax=Armillaria luteobubalina TaxID=153913 RepID=A0AA39UJB0_9AGAR|nr:hypothetical protein EDD18DRAFT_1113021 [Armillaria luteobubalina]